MDRGPERSGHRLGGSSLRTGATGLPGPENVPCGVHVRMVFVPAGDAPEGGLIRSVFRRDVAADETGPGRVPGIHPDQAASVSGQLVLQQREKRSPSLRQEGAVQSGLLPDISSGGLPGAPGAPGHVPDLQILDIDDRLGFADHCRGLVEKIQAHGCDPFVGSRHPVLLLSDVVAFRPLPELPGELKWLALSRQKSSLF